MAITAILLILLHVYGVTVLDFSEIAKKEARENSQYIVQASKNILELERILRKYLNNRAQRVVFCPVPSSITNIDENK